VARRPCPGYSPGDELFPTCLAASHYCRCPAVAGGTVTCQRSDASKSEVARFSTCAGQGEQCHHRTTFDPHSAKGAASVFGTHAYRARIYDAAPWIWSKAHPRRCLASELHRLSGNDWGSVRSGEAFAIAGQRSDPGLLSRTADVSQDWRRAVLYSCGDGLWVASVRPDPRQLRSCVSGRTPGL